MTCREFSTFIGEYVSGALQPEALASFERHLSLCPNCQAYLSNYRDTIDLGRRAFEDDAPDLPADVPADLVNAILASRRGRG